VVTRTADPAALASWETQIVAKLEREKRYPDTAGRVSAYRIERSSGIDALDREVLSLSSVAFSRCRRRRPTRMRRCSSSFLSCFHCETRLNLGATGAAG
jgi:hypothetical protein